MKHPTSPPYLGQLDPVRQAVFRDLKAFADEFVLAGGTAMMLQIGHRFSYDFDCFTEKKLAHDAVLRKAKTIFGPHIRPHIRTDEVLSLKTPQNIEVTFVFHPFPLLKKPITTNSISLFHLDDLTANKGHVIGRRPAWRDYVDLFFLMKWRLYDMTTLITLAEKKFTGEFHDKLFLEQLTYFEDLEIVPTAFLKESYTPDDIKNFLSHQVELYLKSVLP